LKVKWKNYALWILISEAVGALSAWLTRTGTRLYSATVEKPPLSPPELVFPIAWGILYALMGIGAARIAAAPPSGEKRRSLALYFAQLTVNFFWSIIFFNVQAFGFAFIWLLLLWALAVLMTLSFANVDRLSARLQIPYLLWLSFAAYLNFGVWYLNR